MSVTYTFISSSGNLTLTADDDLVSHNPVRTHTGISDNQATFAFDDRVIPYVQRQNRVNVDFGNGVEWTGYAIDFDENVATGEMTVYFDGIGKKLEETRPDYASLGGSLVYTNIALDDALEDYWARTPFTNYTVTPQQKELVVENAEVHEANTTAEFSNLFSPTNATVPVVAEGDSFHPAQASWTTDFDSNTSNTKAFDDPNFSGGFGARLEGSGDYIEFSFSPDYDVTGSDLNGWVRLNSSGQGPELTVTVTIDGTSQSWSPVSDVAEFATLEWRDFFNQTFGGSGSYDDSDWPEGSTVTVRIEATTSGAGMNIDVVAPLDNRFNWTLDNNNGGNDGYLDGPELYPNSAEAISDTVGVAYNIVHSDVTSSIDDTTGVQRISVSNDNGDTYANFSNTQTVSHDYTDSGREAKLKVQLGRYGSRTNATPTTGYLPQTLSSITHEIDGDNTVVIDRLELSRNHFDNLKTLHEFGDFLWVIEHDGGAISDMTVSSFQRGDETRPAPVEFDEPIDINRKVRGGTYYNSIYLQGQIRDDGTRPTAEIKNQDEINAKDREISPGVLRDPNISTDAGADFRATALLNKAITNDEISGEITIPPVITDPGYARDIDFGYGTLTRTVEEIRLTESNGQTQATVNFVAPSNIAKEITELKRNSREQGNLV